MVYCVLAGGKSRRMGCDKAFLQFGDKFALELLLERFYTSGERVCLSSAAGDIGERLIHMERRPEEIGDCIADIGPAGGIYSLLKVLKDDIFVVATDMPFADVRFARCLKNLGGQRDLIVMERENGMREMLFAYYGQSCLKPLESMIHEGDYRLQNLAARVGCAAIPQSVAAKAYGAGWERTLFNMNTPEDYKIAQGMFLT